MIKLKSLLIKEAEMNVDKAEEILAGPECKVQNPKSLSIDELNELRKKLAGIYHSDKGHETNILHFINPAIDALIAYQKQISNTTTRSTPNNQPQYVAGNYYAGSIMTGGRVSTPGHKFNNNKEALDWLRRGGKVFAPGASFQGYHKFFGDMEYKDVKVIDQTSSAGDWIFGLFDGRVWIFGIQENAYPKRGFIYAIDNLSYRGRSFEDLVNNG